MNIDETKRVTYFVNFDTEVEVEGARGVFEDPAERAVVLRVDPLDVLVVHLFAQQLPVHAACEVRVQQTTVVVDHLPDHAADELEERQVLQVILRGAVRLVRKLVRRTWREDGVVGVEHPMGEDLNHSRVTPPTSTPSSS